MKIIGIMGKLNSGKDTIAQAYVDRGYIRLGFGDPIKEIVHDLFDIPREILWGSSKERTGEVRRMLQGLGTDFARSFRPNVWVDKMKGQITTCDLMGDHGVVIPDVRFINEAELLHAMDATIIQIKRPLSGSHETHEANTHLSETENTLIPLHWITHTIINDGSLEDLQQKINMVVMEAE